MQAVTVIIPTWDAAKLLEKSLPPVLAQDYENFEVIVVDNGSPNEDTTDLVQKYQKEHKSLFLISRKQQLGYTGAVNEGIRNASHNLIFVLGNDNYISKNFLTQLMQQWKDDFGAIMCRTEVKHQNPAEPGTMNFCARNVLYFAENLNCNKWIKEPTPIFYPGGNAFLFDTSKLGLPFEDFYFTYQEDVAFGWRLRNLGLPIYHCYFPCAYSFDGGSTKRESVHYRTSFYSERNRLINLLTFPESSTIFKLAPLWDFDTVCSFLFGCNRRAKLHAWFWIFWNFNIISELRDQRQAERKVSDKEVFKNMSKLYLSESIYNNKFHLPRKIINWFFYRYLKLVGLA